MAGRGLGTGIHPPALQTVGGHCTRSCCCAFRRIALAGGPFTGYAFVIDNQPMETAMSQSDELAKLAELHRSGALTDDEFMRAKARVLNGTASQDAPAVRAVNGFRRSADDRWLGGVCGGIAQSAGLPSWVLRLFFTVMVLFAGTGVVIYLLLWFFVPLAPANVGGYARPV